MMKTMALGAGGEDMLREEMKEGLQRRFHRNINAKKLVPKRLREQIEEKDTIEMRMELIESLLL